MPNEYLLFHVIQGLIVNKNKGVVSFIGGCVKSAANLIDFIF